MWVLNEKESGLIIFLFNQHQDNQKCYNPLSIFQIPTSGNKKLRTELRVIMGNEKKKVMRQVHGRVFCESYLKCEMQIDVSTIHVHICNKRC